MNDAPVENVSMPNPPSFLTKDDEDLYGRDLISFSMRAAAQAVAPTVQALERQNAELAQQVARETRKNLDQGVAAAIPNYREIDQDPRWHRWLLGVDSLNGRVRQDLLNAAIDRGDVVACVAMFRGFLREYRAASETSATAPGRSRSSGVKPIYTNESIKDLYAQRRKGAFTEDQWKSIEGDLAAALKEGRVAAKVFLTK
jgi:hypothetical protein